jgi:hypothetical protein
MVVAGSLSSVVTPFLTTLAADLAAMWQRATKLGGKLDTVTWMKGVVFPSGEILQQCRPPQTQSGLGLGRAYGAKVVAAAALQHVRVAVIGCRSGLDGSTSSQW